METKKDLSHTNENKTTILHSSGFLLYRYNDKNKYYEVLLIQKRVSNSFIAVVLGQYNIKNKHLLKFLFSTMTLQEKLDLLSLDFEMLWYKVWLELTSYPYILNINTNNLDILCKSIENIKRYKYVKTFIPYVRNTNLRGRYYTKCKNKFEKCFVSDGGYTLRMIMNNTSNIQLNWQLPKGRQEYNELPINTAVRELKEETNISIDDCKIHYNIKPSIITNLCNKKKYVNTYFVAKYIGNDEPVLNISTQFQLNECSCIKWCSMEYIKHINIEKSLLLYIKKTIKLIKNKKFKI